MLRNMKKTAASVFVAAMMMTTMLVPAANYATIQAQAEETTITADATTAAAAETTTTTAEKAATTTTAAKAATTTAKKTTTTTTYKVIATGKVKSKILNIRSSKSTKAKKLTTLKKNKKVQILSTGSKWVKVKIGKIVGYTQGKYIKTTYGTASNLYKNSVGGKTSKTLKIYSKKSTGSKLLKTLSKNKKITVLTVGSKWVAVKSGNTVGYALGSKIKLNKGGTASSPYSSKGKALVAYAKKFLGNPYVWGGSSLTHGTDCSGFVMALYRHYGYHLPHSSYSLRSVGRAVHGLSNAKPGDIICYNGHVAIYMGGGKIIHASSKKTGIKITKNANYRHIVAIRRIFK